MRRLGLARSAPPAPVTLTAEDHEKLRLLLALVTDRSQPNINQLIETLRNVDILALNVKAMGYRLARELSAALPPPTGTAPDHVGLASKMATQVDIGSNWTAHWCAELQVPHLYHRKMWEYAYLLQALHERGLIREGARGLGFGCGTEPVPSYLAAKGLTVTMTDLPPEDARAAGWSATGQHAATPEHARDPRLIDADTFAARVEQRHVDMNAIPADLDGYDFCWSLCALEHLGSIAQGLDFIRNSLTTLRPGGVAVHTLEYNINPIGPTIDNWPTVLFQQRHVEGLAARLAAEGHTVAPFDFDAGSGALDRFIDLPPGHDHAMGPLSDWLGYGEHIKVAVDGFVATSFGIIVTKGGA